MNADFILAFSPQTFVDSVLRNKHGDRRFARQIREMHELTGDDKNEFDLKKMLPIYKQVYDYKAVIKVVYGSEDDLDFCHADHIKNCGNVQVQEIEGCEHYGVVQRLRDDGRLKAMLEEVL